MARPLIGRPANCGVAMAVQRQLRFRPEGIYYSLAVLAVLFGAVSRQLNLLMLLGSVLAGPLVFSLIYGRLMLGRVQVRRRLPAQFYAGQRLVIDLSVANAHRRLALWAIRVEDAVRRDGVAQAADEMAKVNIFVPQVAPRQSAQVSYNGLLRRRGRYRFGPLRVSTLFPLGFVRHSLVLEGTDELLVHPKLGQLLHDWANSTREHAIGDRRMQRRGLLEADFYGLRDWRTGDSRRWIHWRTSARRGSLVVRQFEQRRSQDLALLVDLWQPSDPREDHLENVEAAVSFSGTLVADACRRPGPSLIVSIAAREPLERSGAASPMFFREQMDSLSIIEAHDQASFPDCLARALATVPPSMPTLIVSTRSIDCDALRAAAANRGAQLEGRSLQLINVAGGELADYFQA
jgi:uncharacterized protein (DUF58 family)